MNALRNAAALAIRSLRDSRAGAHNAKPPAWERREGFVTVTKRWLGGMCEKSACSSLFAQSLGHCKPEVCVMKSRSRPEGRQHRARLRAMVLPGLRIGARLPKGAWLAVVLGICEAEASRHLHRMLAEAGVVTFTRRGGRDAGIFVVSVPENSTSWGIAA